MFVNFKTNKPVYKIYKYVSLVQDQNILKVVYSDVNENKYIFKKNLFYRMVAFLNSEGQDITTLMSHTIS